MKKILIIGSSGAGKTTLARQISTKLSLPHVELDSIYHQENWKPLDEEKFTQQVYEIASKDEWVLCGNYFSKLGLELWQKADVVIWCDYSFPLVLSRLLRRTFIRGIKKEMLWNGNRERLYVNFLTRESLILWMLKAWNKQKRRYSKLFASPNVFPNTELVHLKSPNDTKKFLREI